MKYMALELNETRLLYKEFYGKNIEQMPRLIADRRVPLSIAELMQRRLDCRNSDPGIRSSYFDNCFDTGDAIVYHPDGRAKIVLDSEDLRTITPESQISYGALPLTEDDYNTLRGEEFKKGMFRRLEGGLSRDDVKVHPIWKVLARDQALLNEYADYVFAEVKERSNSNTAMEIYLSYASGKTPEMMIWGFNNFTNISHATTRTSLNNSRGSLIGKLL